MQTLLAEYLPILIFLGIAVGLTLVIVAGLPDCRSPSDPTARSCRPTNAASKPSTTPAAASTCGSTWCPLLFIIFDLEVAFLFPWAISLGDVGVFGFWSMVAFLGVLTVGFIYEWKKGALDWE